MGQNYIIRPNVVYDWHSHEFHELGLRMIFFIYYRKKMVTNASNLVKTIQQEIATFLPGLKVDSTETSVFTSPCAIVTIQIVSIATPVSLNKYL